MQHTASTPRVGITVASVALLAIAPFAEGHVLTPNEANVLNQTLAENLRNNFASVVRDRLAIRGEDGKATDQLRAATDADKAELQAAFDKYITEYEFGVRRAGARVVDPIEKEALSIAKDAVKSALAKKGFKLGDGEGQVGKAKFQELVDGYSKKPEVLKEAARRVKQAQSLALDELGLG